MTRTRNKEFELALIDSLKEREYEKSDTKKALEKLINFGWTPEQIAEKTERPLLWVKENLCS